MLDGNGAILALLALGVMGVSLWIACAVSVKRLHDIGLSGGWVFVTPFMILAGGGIVWLFLVAALGAAPERAEENSVPGQL